MNINEKSNLVVYLTTFLRGKILDFLLAIISCEYDTFSSLYLSIFNTIDWMPKFKSTQEKI